MFITKVKFLLIMASAGILSACEDVGTVAKGMAAFSQGYASGYSQSEAFIRSQTPQVTQPQIIGQPRYCRTYGTNPYLYCY